MKRPSRECPNVTHSFEVVRDSAERLRRKQWSDGQIPIDVDLIIERLGICLVPIPNMQSLCAMDACLSPDLTVISVDHRLIEDPMQAFRVRFSLAHELGHRILHKEFYKWFVEEILAEANDHGSVLDWARLVTETAERLFASHLEREADEFAGRFLVPVDALRSDLSELMSGIGSRDLDGMDDSTVRKYLGRKLNRRFAVNPPVITYRLLYEQLYPRPEGSR